MLRYFGNANIMHEYASLTSTMTQAAYKISTISNCLIPGIVKIKTIGSTYMCASGLNTSAEDPEVLIQKLIMLT